MAKVMGRSFINIEAACSRVHIRQRNNQSRNVSTQSSRAWLDRQHKDPYVLKAQELGLPSRAYFKLEEINEKLFHPAIVKKHKLKATVSTRLILRNMLVLDLGAAPGGWSVYASSQLDQKAGGAVVSVDLLPLNYNVTDRIQHEMNGRFEFIQGDFTNSKIRSDIIDAFSRLSFDEDSTQTDETQASAQQQKANLIISDMASNFTGDSSTDAIRTINLCEQSLAFAAGEDCFDTSHSPRNGNGMLTKNGSFLCKYFKCGEENERDLMDAAKRVFQSIHKLKPGASRKESSEMYLLGFNRK